MPKLTLRLDLRAPDFGAPRAALYAASLEMAEWADRHGFAECMLSEHHGSEDGYLPSPLLFGAAIAARSRRMRIQVSALVLPLHDPVRIAEDVAVLDNLSGGRVELVIAGGFLPSEFEMFGRSCAERGSLIEEGIQTLKQAWTGEPFEYRGRRARVQPTPVQQPHPPLLLGGSSKRSARRAARIADGYVPAVPELYALYTAECERLGGQAAPPRTVGSFALFVAEDPDATWAKIAPHALHESRSYARWYVEGNASGPYQDFESADALRASQLYQVLTPDQCIALVEEMGPELWLYLHPLVGGLDPAVGWESLDLLAAEVLPRLSVQAEGDV